MHRYSATVSSNHSTRRSKSSMVACTAPAVIPRVASSSTEQTPSIAMHRARRYAAMLSLRTAMGQLYRAPSFASQWWETRSKAFTMSSIALAWLRRKE
eukprot:2138128-Pyramimonas_sp.AAC.1